MRYRYFNVVSGRKVFSLALALFVLPVAFSSCGKLISPRHAQIREGVTFEGKTIGGLTMEEARVVIGRSAETLGYPAVDAVLDPETKGVIPGLDGLEMDTEATLTAALQAEKRSVVEPVYRSVPAAVSLEDFPYYPVYQGNPEKPQVAFLINVAWGNEYLQEMLDVLKNGQAQATFFLVGRWVRSSEADARVIADSGFEIANHGDSDAMSMGKASLVEAADDIRKAADTIERVCGKRPVFFSPHRGEVTEAVLQAAASENSRLVMWTVDTVDWTLPGVDVMVEKILTRSEGGSLILMHPTQQTAEFLRQVIPSLREKGLEPVALSELLSPTRP